MSSIVDKIKQLFLTKSDKPHAEENPWEESAPTAPSPQENPWKPQPHPNLISTRKVVKMDGFDNVWVKPGRGFKENVLRKASFLLIVLNIAIGLLFYSNNLQFNAALYTYLGASTLVIGHYISLTR